MFLGFAKIWFRGIHDIVLNHCGLVTPYVDIDLSHHWLR